MGMALRDFTKVPYLPLLALSPAEMQGLQELPNKDKDLLLPYVHLRPWMGSLQLENSLKRIEKSYGSRPYILDIADAEPGDAQQTRPVFSQLRDLRDPAGGYRNWCDFVAQRKQIIPAIQLRAVNELPAQLSRIYGLGRGVAVHLRPQMLGAVSPLAATIGALTNGGEDVCVVADFGRQRADFLLNQLRTVGVIQAVRAAAPKAHVAISASSFPEGFIGLEDQDIFERQHFNGVSATVGAAGLIYSDRGSARAEKQMGGGGTPAPRIDYARDEKWTFFRSEPVIKELRPAAYVAQAKKAVAAGCWDPNLDVWGNRMIEKTALEKPNRIKSQQDAAASRINIHLHRQLFHSDQASLYDTDEDWED